MSYIGLLPFVWEAFRQASMLLSPDFLIQWPSWLPQAQKEETAWCFKLLLREGWTRVYVQERREVIHVQKEVAPAFSSRD